MDKPRPTIVITIGDCNGIGPEVTLKALAKSEIRESARFVILGPIEVLEKQLIPDRARLRKITKIQAHTPEPGIEVLDDVSAKAFCAQPGKISPPSGAVAGRALVLALELATSGDADAVVTAPISKQAFNQAGYNFPGQTELLGSKFPDRQAVMVLLSRKCKVGLATNHCPLSDVASRIDQDLLLKKLDSLSRDLQTRFRIAAPKIAVAALNPHAGEGGLLGTEEQEIIAPAVERARQIGLRVDGPFSADTLFARSDRLAFAAYLAMYHDQGLIPIKMLSFGKAVNYTAGLPIIRTSPDHGTAFDIAGKGIADSGSMEEAIKLAVKLAVNSRAN